MTNKTRHEAYQKATEKCLAARDRAALAWAEYRKAEREAQDSGLAEERAYAELRGFPRPSTPAPTNIGHALLTLETAADHLRQYRAYAEQMREIGRGCDICSPYTPEALERMIARAMADLR